MPTKTLAVNANNDIFVDAEGNISIAFNLQAILQQCAQAGKTLLGEMVFNINQGIPYFESVWIGTPNIEQYTASLRRSFLSITGVLEVVSLITSQINNTLSYTAVIRTIYGSGGFTGA